MTKFHAEIPYFMQNVLI